MSLYPPNPCAPVPPLPSSGSVNEAYFQNLITRINAIPSCSQELIILTTDAMKLLNPLIQKLNAQIALAEQLIIAPTDLFSVITWINKVISQYLIPYEKDLIEVVAYTTQKTQVLVNIQQKISNCSNFNSLFQQAQTLGLDALVNTETGVATTVGNQLMKDLGINPACVNAVLTLTTIIQIAQGHL